MYTPIANASMYGLLIGASRFRGGRTAGSGQNNIFAFAPSEFFFGHTRRS
jgi:hypothetical protein